MKRTRVLAMAAAVGAMAVAAHGQRDTTDFRIDSAEHRQCVRMIGLDDDQAARADEMHEAWLAEFNDAAAARRKLLDWIYANNVSSISHGHDSSQDYTYHDQQRILRLWDIGARALEERYFDHLAELASDRRAEVERARRGHIRKRLADPKTPMGETVAGTNIDLTAMIESIAPELRSDPIIRTVLDPHEVQLDRLLRRLDELTWKYGDLIRSAFDRARAAREAQSPDLPRLLEEAAQLMIRRHEPYPVIRTLNKQTARRLLSVLPPAQAAQLQQRVERAMHSYVYEHEGAAHLRLQAALARPTLTDEQRQSLAAVQRSIDAARAETIKTLGPLYDRTISVEYYQREYRQYFERWAAHQHMSVDPPENQEFDAALEQWRQRERRFGRDVAAAVGENDPEAIEADITLLADDDIEQGQSVIEHYAPMLSPMISGGELERFLAGLADIEPGRKAVIKTLHGELAAAYDQRVATFRAEIARAWAKVRAYERIHSDAASQPRNPDFSMTAAQLSFMAWHSRIEGEFRDDVGDALGALHQPQWQAVLRQLRRRSELPQRDHERRQNRHAIDLTLFVGELELTADERPRVGEALAAYELALDGLLQEAERLRMRSIELMAALDQKADEQVGAEFARTSQKYWEQMQQVQQASMRHAAAIGQAMDEINRRRFQSAMDRQVFPELFKPCPVEQAVELLSFRQLLVPEEIASLKAVEQEYQTIRDGRAHEIIAICRAWDEPGQRRRRSERQQRLIAEGVEPWEARDGHPATALLTQRREHAIAACVRIRGVIGEERLAAMPLATRLLLSWWE